MGWTISGELADIGFVSEGRIFFLNLFVKISASFVNALIVSSPMVAKGTSG